MKPTTIEAVLSVMMGAVIFFMISIHLRIGRLEEALMIPVEEVGLVEQLMPIQPMPQNATHLWAKISPEDSTRIVIIENKIDSLEMTDQAFAKSILYLDSCNNSKLTKVERAERRGRFVGGLLRGLFPRIPGN